MISRRLPLLSVFAALVFVSSTALAQFTMSPASGAILLGSGKSGTVKISVSNSSCNPSWTAESSDGNKVSVSPASASSGGSRTFKIKAASGQFSASETVTITVTGVGDECADVEVIVVSVFVSMDAAAGKRFEKGDKGAGVQGVKGRAKTLKSAIKSIEKGLKSDFAQILKDQKAGTLVSPEDGGGLPQALLAFDASSDCAADAFDELLDAYEDYIIGLAQDGYSVQSLYGLLAFLEYFVLPDFAEGSCGAWDRAVLDGSHSVNTATYGIDTQFKQQSSKIVKESSKTNHPIAINPGFTYIGFPLSTFGLTPTETGTPDQEAGKSLGVRKASASNFVDDEQNNDHGRIKLKGRAPSSGGTVDITYELLGSDGDPVGMAVGERHVQMGVTVNAKCKFKSTAPNDTLPNLKPGRWRITMDQGGTVVTHHVTVPTGTAGVD